jgi:hypothetical protein
MRYEFPRYRTLLNRGVSADQWRSYEPKRTAIENFRNTFAIHATQGEEHVLIRQPFLRIAKSLRKMALTPNRGK